MPRAVESPQRVTFKGGGSSSKIPRFDLIPRGPLVRIADRMELGLERHKERAWNGAQNQQILEDESWVIARAAHVIDHATKLIEVLRGQREPIDDDAAAIAWGGIALCEATRVLAEKQAKPVVFQVSGRRNKEGNLEVKGRRVKGPKRAKRTSKA